MKYREPSYAGGVYDVFFFEKNLQGDIVSVYNSTGEKVLSYTYDAWGNFTQTYVGGTQAQIFTAQKNPFRYRGYYYDTDTGLYYLQSRYYNPQWGRFLNADSFLYTSFVGCNIFTYCENTPIVYTDSTGYWFGIDDVFTGPIDEIIVLGGLSLLAVCGVAWADDMVEGLENSIENVIDSIGTLYPTDSLTISDVSSVAITTVGLSDVIQAKNKYDPNPYKRPEQKKQGRENRNKSRKSDSWKPRNNRRDNMPAKPKHHTPGRGHSHYKGVLIPIFKEDLWYE